MRKFIILSILFLFLVSCASAATLPVPTKYKTIQGAVNAAKSGDTISVASGTYKELVKVNDKDLIFIGQAGKYPTVYGFEFGVSGNNIGSADINGFKITKYGVAYGIAGNNIVRNNYFYNKGVSFCDQKCSGNSIINNQFFNCGIVFWESYNNIVTGNKINNAATGLGLYEGANCDKISGNTFSYCKVAVKLYEVPAGMTGNKYVKNTKNIQTGVY